MLVGIDKYQNMCIIYLVAYGERSTADMGV